MCKLRFYWGEGIKPFALETNPKSEPLLVAAHVEEESFDFCLLALTLPAKFICPVYAVAKAFLH